MQLSMPTPQTFATKSLSDTHAFALALLFHLSLAAAAFLAMRLPQPQTAPPRPIEVRLVQAEKAAPVATPQPEPLKPVPTMQRQKPPPKQPAPPAPAPMATQPAAPPPPAAPVAAAMPSAVEPVPAPVPFTDAKFDAAYLNNPKPVYPPAARRRGETGTVLLRVQISESGEALMVEVKSSSGSESLDRSARETVAKWKFAPARKGAHPVAAWVIVPIKFTLNEE